MFQKKSLVQPISNLLSLLFCMFNSIKSINTQISAGKRCQMCENILYLFVLVRLEVKFAQLLIICWNHQNIQAIIRTFMAVTLRLKNFVSLFNQLYTSLCKHGLLYAVMAVTKYVYTNNNTLPHTLSANY